MQSHGGHYVVPAHLYTRVTQLEKLLRSKPRKPVGFETEAGGTEAGGTAAILFSACQGQTTACQSKKPQDRVDNSV